jgi:hypothetical protein
MTSSFSSPSFSILPKQINVLVAGAAPRDRVVLVAAVVFYFEVSGIIRSQRQLPRIVLFGAGSPRLFEVVSAGSLCPARGISSPPMDVLHASSNSPPPPVAPRYFGFFPTQSQILSLCYRCLTGVHTVSGHVVVGGVVQFWRC